MFYLIPDLQKIIDGEKPMTAEMQQAVQWLTANGYSETEDVYSWIPIGDAYDRFCLDPDNQCPLSSCIFGFSFHLAFPNAERVIRRIGKGKKSRGWAGMSGPGERHSVDPGQGHMTIDWIRSNLRKADKREDRSGV